MLISPFAPLHRDSAPPSPPQAPPPAHARRRAALVGGAARRRHGRLRRLRQVQADARGGCAGARPASLPAPARLVRLRAGERHDARLEPDAPRGPQAAASSARRRGHAGLAARRAVAPHRRAGRCRCCPNCHPSCLPSRTATPNAFNLLPLPSTHTLGP